MISLPPLTGGWARTARVVISPERGFGVSPMDRRARSGREVVAYFFFPGGAFFAGGGGGGGGWGLGLAGAVAGAPGLAGSRWGSWFSGAGWWATSLVGSRAGSLAGSLCAGSTPLGVVWVAGVEPAALRLAVGARTGTVVLVPALGP